MRHRASIFLFFIICFAITGFAKKSKGMVSFRFYGSQWSVRFSDQLSFAMPDSSTSTVFDTVHIEQYIRDTYEDCMTLKSQKRLNDWAYMKMLDSLSVACYSSGNEATLMKAYMMAKSGYDVVLLREDNSLYMGYYTNCTVYNKSFCVVDNKNYYIDNKKVTNLLPLRVKGRPVSFEMRELPLLEIKKTKSRKLETRKDRKKPSLSIEVSVNQNLLDFYSQYPSSSKNYDFITRWAIMANIPLDEYVKQQIYPVLRKELAGLNQLDAVQRLLTFVQTALDYEYDEKIWGYDRAFFAEESLFYPYADSGDRVILLSRLIRDLVGLEVVMLYFPGHLSMAVHFDEEMDGASVIYNGDRFVICDPCYIGSDVGEAMPMFADEDPQRMILLYK